MPDTCNVIASPIPDEDSRPLNETLAGTSDSHDGNYDGPTLEDTDPQVQFSAGDGHPDLMAESLARALREAGIECEDEHPLHEADEVLEDFQDPFYSEGRNQSTTLSLRF